MSDDLKAAGRWLGLGLATALVSSGLLVYGRLEWAAAVGAVGALLLAGAGARVTSALKALPDGRRIDYPYDAAQRGRRLAWTALVTTLGLTGFGLVPELAQSLVGPRLFVLVGGAALLGPVVTLTMALWTIDGIALSVGGQRPADPLIGATGSLGLSLVLAVGATTAGWPVSTVLLAAFAGLVPCLFLLWSIARLDRLLEQPLARPVS